VLRPHVFLLSRNLFEKPLGKIAESKKYVSPDALQLKEVERPTPMDNEVLVKTHAASINATDLGYLKRIKIKDRGRIA